MNVDPALVVSSDTTGTCPDIVLEIVNAADDSPIDSSIFQHVEPDLIIESVDIAAVGVYQLKLQAFYEGM